MIRLADPEIHEEEIQAVTAVLRSGYLVQGEHVQQFERLVAEYVGADYAYAVTSGTAALHLALLASDIGFGDEVIIPDFTFPATANVVELVGAKPVLVDIDLASFNMDARQLRPAVTERTKAIIPVHLFGQSADMDPIFETAEEYDLSVIEDAACALGAEYKGYKCGSMGNVGCFSFHPRKAITTGEGGMVVTNDRDVARRISRLRNHGMAQIHGQNRLEMPGFNYRMTDLQGALGAVQMTRLEGIIRRRTELARSYGELLAGIACIECPFAMEGLRHIWQSYVILLEEDKDRDRTLRALRDLEIEAGIGTYALSAQRRYRNTSKAFPNSSRAYKQGICLPLHSKMSATDIEEISKCLEKALSKENQIA